MDDITVLFRAGGGVSVAALAWFGKVVWQRLDRLERTFLEDHVHRDEFRDLSAEVSKIILEQGRNSGRIEAIEQRHGGHYDRRENDGG